MQRTRAWRTRPARDAALEMDTTTFRALGHRLVDQLADSLASIPHGPVTPGEAPSAVRAALASGGSLPEEGTEPGPLLEQTARLLFDHSLFNAHPRFFGYITSSPSPIGILGDFLASAVNANVGSFILSPAATEIEAQTVRWIAELIGYPADCGGLLVSGGNMANFVCFLAARQAKAGWNVREQGLGRDAGRRLRVYGSGGDAHVDSEGGGPERTRRRVNPVDSDRRDAAHGRGGAAAAARSGQRRGRCAVHCRWNRRLREHRALSIRCAISPPRAGSTVHGSTSMARMAVSRLPCLRRLMTCAH
jgi:hypothetical protein